MPLFDVYPKYDFTPVKGVDVYLYDSNKERYLDLYGGHAVISIGHSHPYFVRKLNKQVSKICFYSNAVINPLQEELAEKLCRVSGCEDYQLFLCNSGAEANENALKLASFETQKSRIIAFKNAFHGRTSASVAVTYNTNIQAAINKQHLVTFLNLGDTDALESELKKGDVCAVIFETIQGVGGLDEANSNFYKQLEALCHKHHCIVIADEVQSGFGRTGDFFAFQKHGIKPHIISMAKGMGNGVPIGGILIHPSIKPKHGILGSTFGGNHLACTAAIAVVNVIEKQNLMKNARKMDAFVSTIELPPQVKMVKGRGLMLGFVFDFEVSNLRKQLFDKHQILVGDSSNKNLIRLLPSLTVKKKHFLYFVDALNKALQP